MCIYTQRRREAYTIYLCFSIHRCEYYFPSEAHTSVVGGKACGLTSRASIMWISLYICLALFLYMLVSRHFLNTSKYTAAISIRQSE